MGQQQNSGSWSVEIRWTNLGSEVESQRGWMFLLFIFCVIHFAMRLCGLSGPSFWWDESFTWYASLDLPYVFRRVAADVHPPAYFLLVSVWKDLFGISELSLRSPSAIFSTLTLVTLMFHARAATDTGRAKLVVCVALMFSFLPYEIHLARFARNYTMLMFLSSLFSYFFFGFVLSDNRRFLFGAIATGIITVYTHHMALVYVPVTLMSGALVRFSLRKSVFTLILAGIIGAAYWPWYHVLSSQLAIKHHMTHFRFVSQVTAGELLAILNPHPTHVVFSSLEGNVLGYLGLVIAAASIVLIVTAIARIWTNPWTKALVIQVSLFLLLMALSPEPLWNERNLCLLVGPCLVLLSYAATAIPRFFKMDVSTVFLLTFITVSAMGWPHANAFPDWRGAFRTVSELKIVRKASRIITCPSWDFTTLPYYNVRGLVGKDLLTRPPIRTDCKRLFGMAAQVFATDASVTDILVLDTDSSHGGSESREQNVRVREAKQFQGLTLYSLRRMHAISSTY